MALKIRLSRVGTKNEPHYRVVVAEQRSRRDGDAVEHLGAYNPRAKGNPLTIKLDRVDYWVGKGAKPTSTLHAMIKRARRAAEVSAEQKA
jgi:small subunit ribosomal protein S16